MWKTFPFFSLLLETCLEPRQTSRMEHFSENSWRLKVAKEKNSVIDLWQCFKYTTDYNMFKTVQLILWMPDNLVLLYAVPENVLRNLLNINWNIEIPVDAFSCRITKIFHGEFNHELKPDIEIFVTFWWDFYQLSFNWFTELFLCGLYLLLTMVVWKKSRSSHRKCSAKKKCS